MDPIFCNQVRHLYEVERLSIRQIAKKLRASTKRISRVIRNEKISKPIVESILKPYERLIDQWYQDYPFLKASQVYQRLKAYEYKGGYTTVTLYTQKHRRKRRQPYHELTFLPGEEVQIDWIEQRFPWGAAYGFAMILAYSRYLYIIPGKVWSSSWKAISKRIARWEALPVDTGMTI